MSILDFVFARGGAQIIFYFYKEGHSNIYLTIIPIPTRKELYSTPMIEKNSKK